MHNNVRFLIFFAFWSLTSNAQKVDVNKMLKGFDEMMAQNLLTWNSPGACIGIVVKDKLVFAKGYGYRDYEKKLPVTPNTLFQIASNTKLFTTIATGMLVEEGKLDWDMPIKGYVPSIEFYNSGLNETVTMRDMLSHRTGISRHDMIWFKSNFTRKQLFEKLKYMEPSQPIRQGFLYNNLMYTAAGYITELLSGKTWEDYVRSNIFAPLGMNNTVFSIADMVKQADYAVPYNEKRDTTTLYKIPYYEDTEAVGPAGSIISNVNDISHWLIALMNNGLYEAKQVLPATAVKASMQPSIALPNVMLEKGYGEILNSVYGMGRQLSSYRGHLWAYHGGSLPGFQTQISYMPQDSIGVIVFVIGDQGASLTHIATLNIYDRLLNLSQTPWNERELRDYLAGKKITRDARSKASVGRIAGTKPSHKLDDYTGRFENEPYGIIEVEKKDTSLQFRLNNIVLPLQHFHYDRFDTPNDEELGLYSLNYITNPQGEIEKVEIALDESQTRFTRKADIALSDPKTVALYAGKYEIAGTNMEVVVQNKNELSIVIAGQRPIHLLPYKPQIFQTKEYADLTVEFIVVNGKVTAFKQKDPSGEYEIKRKTD